MCGSADLAIPNSEAERIPLRGGKVGRPLALPALTGGNARCAADLHLLHSHGNVGCVCKPVSTALQNTPNLASIFG